MSENRSRSKRRSFPTPPAKNLDQIVRSRPPECPGFVDIFLSEEEHSEPIEKIADSPIVGLKRCTLGLPCLELVDTDDGMDFMVEVDAEDKKRTLN
ncbi:hypothetical protein HUJ04_004936 [Dendroctonus ponderosae]|nr:hypothetical protein HUJ04_004936 [Dendroctonus ponderosae]KAH1015230.1 hypothetical protein HUJ05_012995 [Dendroctonus ponderosae]